MANDLNRRDFLSKTALAASAFALPTAVGAASSEKKEADKTASFVKKDGAKKLGVGFIGVGLRGQNHVSEIMLRDDCEVVAFADPDHKMMADALSEVKKAGRAAPKTFGNGPRDFLNLLKMKEVDAVIIATPWEWHTEQAVAAMRAGKATASEVCGAFSLDECWQLVNVQEETGAPFMFLENVCYRRDVMAVLNMVRQGLFGEMMHLEGGYQHDLRHVKFNDGQKTLRRRRRIWRKRLFRSQMAHQTQPSPQRRALSDARHRAGGDDGRHQSREPFFVARVVRVESAGTP